MTESTDPAELATQLGEQLIDTIIQGDSTDAIKNLIEDGAPVWYQNDLEGMSPLHAAAYTRNLELVKYLIEKGAIWNAVDYLKNTAGDIALSFNDTEIYTVIRDSGIRAELLLGILSAQANPELPSSSGLILRHVDTTAAGSNEAYLKSRLRYTQDESGQDICFINVGGGEIGVMMGWEAPVMHETVQCIYDSLPNRDNIKVLNVGFGLGIIDKFFQALPTPPSKHVIIEPHPDVLRYMRDNGWYEKPGVQILEGKWQDFVEHEDFLAFGGFDVVYTDTFSENYSDLHQFFEHLPNILADSSSRFSFFNGLGATNPLFYDVYTRVAELHLADIGLDVHWSDVDVRPQKYEQRWGNSREYFTTPTYRLPLAYLSIMP